MEKKAVTSIHSTDDDTQYCVLGTVLGTKNTEMNRTALHLCPQGTHILEKGDRK